MLKGYTCLLESHKVRSYYGPVSFLKFRELLYGRIQEFADIVKFFNAPLDVSSIQEFQQNAEMVEFMNSRRLFGLKF